MEPEPKDAVFNSPMSVYASYLKQKYTEYILNWFKWSQFLKFEDI